MIDWKTIETEYVTTDISHRQLAEKYGIGRSRLSQYASKEKWKEKRDKHRANTVSKAINAIASQQANRAVRLQTVADKLLTVSQIQAAFVMSIIDGKACISARSDEAINVQIILESLGGGGHYDAAAAQIPDITLAEAEKRLLKACADYLGK